VHQPRRAVSQARPQIFDLQIRVPDVLYEEVVEVDEEVLLPLGTEPDRCTAALPTAHDEGFSMDCGFAAAGGRPQRQAHGTALALGGEKTEYVLTQGSGCMQAVGAAPPGG
jgi:hypothetical protein